MKHMKFSSRAKAEEALEEVLKSHPAGIVGGARNWGIEGHYVSTWTGERVHIFLGEDSKMHEYRREAVK